MAHIVQFEVEGLAGRTGIYKQKLNRDLNLFFGLNGSGKTSLLKILHAAMTKDAAPLVVVPFKNAAVTIYSVKYRKKFVYTLDKEKSKKKKHAPTRRGRPSREVRSREDDLEDELSFAWEIEPLIQGETPGPWWHEYLPTSRLLQMGYVEGRDSGISAHDVGRLIRDEHTLDMQFELALKNRWLDFFGGIQANVRQLQEKALADILNEVLTTRQTKPKKGKTLDWETAYEEMVTFLKRRNTKVQPGSKSAFRKRYGESTLLQKVIARIDRIEKEIEAAMAPRTKLQHLIKRLFSRGKTVKFADTSIDVIADSKESIGLHALSSGEKHFLYILIECLKADISSIIIDEPEISMHVDWQKDLISSMQELNPKAQIIAATHSPEVMANIDDSKIFRL